MTRGRVAGQPAVETLKSEVRDDGRTIARRLGANRFSGSRLDTSSRTLPPWHPSPEGSSGWSRGIYSTCRAALERLKPQDAQGWLEVVRQACLVAVFAWILATILVKSACNGDLVCSFQRTFQVFGGRTTSEDPLAYIGGFSVFIGPLFGALAWAVTYLPAVRRWFLLRTTSRWLDHVIVADTSFQGVAVAKAHRDDGKNVIVLADSQTAATRELERQGGCVIVGDPHSCDTLLKAGIQRATSLYSLSGADREAFSLTASIAEALKPKTVKRYRGKSLTQCFRYARHLALLLATKLNPKSGKKRPDKPLKLFLRVDSPLALPLLQQQAEAHFPDKKSVEVRLLNREDLAVQYVFNRYPLDWGFEPGPFAVHVLIVGCGRVGQAVLKHVSLGGIGSDGGPCTVTIVDRDADCLESRALLKPGLSSHVRLRKFQGDAGMQIAKEQAAKWFSEPVPVTSVYICCGDDFLNLSIAVNLRKAIVTAALGLEAPPFFVDQEESAKPVEVLARLSSMGCDTMRIIPFGLIGDQSDPTYLTEEIDDLMASLIHRRWRRMRAIENRKRRIKGERKLAPREADVEWEKLPAMTKDSNRGQARQQALMLRTLGWHATQLPSARPKNPLPADMVPLARREHERWCRDKLADGWIYAPVGDESKKTHTDLVPFEQLERYKQGLDFDTIKQLSRNLRQIGVHLRREFRLSVWCADDEEPSRALLEKVVKSISERPEGADRHLQLVLPLRVAAEELMVRALLRRSESMSLSFGVDIALLPYVARRAREARRATRQAQEARRSADLYSLVACADRAFCLSANGRHASSTDAEYVTALAGVSDCVLVLAKTQADVDLLLAQVALEVRSRCNSIVA